MADLTYHSPDKHTYIHTTCAHRHT